MLASFLFVAAAGVTSCSPPCESNRNALFVAEIDTGAVDLEPGDPLVGRYPGARLTMQVDWLYRDDWFFECDGVTTVLQNISLVLIESVDCPILFGSDFSSSANPVLDTDALVPALRFAWDDPGVTADIVPDNHFFYTQQVHYVVPEPSPALGGTVALLAPAFRRRHAAASGGTADRSSPIKSSSVTSPPVA